MTNTEEGEKAAVRAYRQWQRGPEIACLFARAIASEPEKYGVQQRVLTPSEGRAETLAGLIDLACAAARSDPECEGITLLLPTIITPRSAVDLVSALGELDEWLLHRTSVNANTETYVAYGLKYQLGSVGGTDVYSEVLGLAPFDFMPITRRSPLLALELRTKTPGSLEPKPPANFRRAHLAALPFHLPQIAFDRIWKKTEDSRSAVLGFDDPRAKAKVTFAFPEDLVGVEPISV